MWPEKMVINKVPTYQKTSSDKNGLGYIIESSSSSKISKEMKFIKAKEPSTPLVKKVKVKKKPNVVNQKVLTKSPNSIVAKPKEKGKSLLGSKTLGLNVLELHFVMLVNHG